MADLLPEKWMKVLAATTTVLAVCAAIAGARSSAMIAQNQVLTAKEGSTWSYYQAKSIKQNFLEAQSGALEITVMGTKEAAQKSRVAEMLAGYAADIKRYDEEKAQIKKDAEAIGQENVKVANQGKQFAIAVVLFQIGIMLSSVSALVKRKEMWAVGTVIGVIGLVFLANGVFLFF